MRRRRYVFWMRAVRFAAKRADRTGIDWIDDDALTRKDIEARLSVLPKVEVYGRPKVVITSSWPLSPRPQTWGTWTGNNTALTLDYEPGRVR